MKALTPWTMRVAAGSLLLVSQQLGHGAVLGTYTFTGADPAGDLAVPTASGMTFGTLTRVGGLSQTTLNDVFSSSTYSKSTSIDTGQYISFVATADPGYKLLLTSLSFDYRRTDTSTNNRGPQAGAVRSSFESYAAGSGTGSTFSPGTSSFATATWNFTDHTTAVDGNAQFRIYGWNATSPGSSPTTGTLQLDNITLQGDIIALAKLNAAITPTASKALVGQTVNLTVGVANTATGGTQQENLNYGITGSGITGVPVNVTNQTPGAGVVNHNLGVNTTTSGAKSVNVASDNAYSLSGTTSLNIDIYQAAALTPNNGGPAKASGDSLTIANANTSDGGQRAAAQIASVSLTGAPGWSVSDIVVGATISQNTTLTGTALFNATGKLNGAHKATFSATLEHDDLTIAGTAANDLGAYNWNLKHVVTGNTGGGTARVFSGDEYAYDTTRQVSRFTSAALIDGSAGGTRDLTVTFADNDGIVLSDIVSLTGTLTDVFVLQISYDEAYVTGNEEDLFLGWWDGSAWVNAVVGNSSGTPTFVLGAYDDDLTLGRHGVDTVNNVVWAVIDHNSDFGVLLIPEPGTIALALTGLALMYRRRPRK